MNKNKSKLLSAKKFWLLAGGLTVTAASTALVVACGTMDTTANANSTDDRAGQLELPAAFNKMEETKAQEKIINPNGDALFQQIHDVVKANASGKPMSVAMLAANKPNSFTSYTVPILGSNIPGVNGLVVGMLLEGIKKVWEIPADTSLLKFLTPLTAAGLNISNQDDLKARIKALTENYDGKGTDATASWADFAAFWSALTNKDDNYSYLKSVLSRPSVLGSENLKNLNDSLKTTFNTKIDIYNPVPTTTTPTTDPKPTTPTETPKPSDPTNPNETTTPAAPVITKKSEAEAISNIVTPGTSRVFQALHNAVKDQPKAEVTVAFLTNKKPSAFNTASIAGFELENTNGLVISMLIEGIKAVWKLDPATPIFALASPLLNSGLSLEDIAKLGNLTQNYDGKGTDATASWADFAYFWELMLDPADNYGYLKRTLGSDKVLGAEVLGKFNEALKEDPFYSVVDIFKPVTTTPGTTNPTTDPEPTTPTKTPTPTTPTETPKPSDPANPNETTTPAATVITKKSEAEAISNIVTPGTNHVFKTIHEAVKAQPGADVTTTYLNNQKPSGFTTANVMGIPLENTNGLVINMLIEGIKTVWKLDPATPLFSLAGPLLSTGLSIDDIGKLANFTQNYDGKGTDATASWADFAYFWELMLNPNDGYAYLKSVLGSDKLLGAEGLEKFNASIQSSLKSTVDIFKPVTTTPGTTNPTTDPEPTTPTETPTPTTPTETPKPSEPGTPATTEPVPAPVITTEAEAIATILNPGDKAVPKMINATATEQGGEALTQALLDRKKPAAFNSIKALGATIPGVNGLLVNMLVEGIKHIWQLPAGIPLTSFLPVLDAAGLSITNLPKLTSMLVNLTKNYRGENTEATDSWADFLAFWTAMTNAENGYSYLKSILGKENVLGTEALKKLNAALATTFNTTFDLFADPADPSQPVTPPKPIEPVKPIDKNVVETNLISRGAVVSRRTIEDAKKYIIDHDEKDVLMVIFKRILTEFAKSKNMTLADLLQSDPNSWEQSEFGYVIKLLGPVALITLLEAIWQVPSGSLDQNTIIAIFTDVMALDLTSLPGILDNLIRNFDGQGTYALSNWDALLYFVEKGGNPYNNFESIKSIIARAGVINEAQLRRLDAILSTPKGLPSSVVTRGGYNYPGLGGKLSIYAGALEKEITIINESEADAINKITQFDTYGPVYKAVFMAAYYADKYSDNYTFYDLKLPVYLEWAKDAINWFIETFDMSDAKRTPTNWKPKDYSQWIIAELMPFVIQQVYGLSDSAREWLQNEDIWKEVFGITRFDFAQRAWTIFSNRQYDSMGIPNANGDWKHLVQFTSWLMSYNLPDKYQKQNDQDFGWKYYKNFAHFMHMILTFREADNKGARSFSQIDLILASPKYGDTTLRTEDREWILGFNDSNKTGVLPGTASQIKERGTTSPWKTEEGRYEYIARWLPYVWGGLDSFDRANNNEMFRFFILLERLGIDLRAAVKKINFTNYDGLGSDATISEAAFFEFLLKLSGFATGRLTILPTYETYRAFKREFQYEGPLDYFNEKGETNKIFQWDVDPKLTPIGLDQTRRTLREMFTENERKLLNIFITTAKDRTITYSNGEGENAIRIEEKGFGGYDVFWPKEY